MSRKVVVDIFAEDRGHEELLRPLLSRIAKEVGNVSPVIQVRSARGGHGRAMGEYRLYQKFLSGRFASGMDADVVVVAIDGNCATYSSTRDKVLSHTDPPLRDRVVVACPDPHVEKWYLADPMSFEIVVGSRPSVPDAKCKRHYYKELLRDAIREGGHPVMLGGVEFARELVAHMDLYRAGKTNPSLKALVDEYRSKLRQAIAP